MTAVGMFGSLLGLLFWRVAFVHATQTRVLVFAGAFITHILAAVLYYQYVQTNSADTALYYYDNTNFYRLGLGLGTQLIIYVVQLMKSTFGGTYLDYFLVFQSLGLGGIALIMRTIEEIYLDSGEEQPAATYLLLFLPGLHFWSSAIGKDAPMFLACALVVWGAIRLQSRFLAFAAGVCLMVLIRPHVALIALVALALATAFDRRVAGFTKVFLLGAALICIAYVAATVESTLQVNIRNPGSVGEFLQRQSEVTSEIGGGSAVVGAAYPMRLLSLLFRPFFFDAGGMYGLIASMENAVLAFIFFVLFRNFRQLWQLLGRVFYLRFALAFGSLLMLMLALVYYNVGLGLRQKTMLMPALLTVFAAVIATRGKRTRRSALNYTMYKNYAAP